MPPRINVPPVTRIVLIALAFQSILSAAIRYRQWTGPADILIPYLTFIPQLSLSYPWTLLTTTLVEGNVFTLAIAAVTLYHGGRYLERAWSSAELAKFLALVSLLPNLLTFCVMLLLFALTRNERWTMATISGTVSIQISFLVAFSQLVPAHTVTLFRGIISLRVPRFPLLYMAVVAVLSLTPLLSRAALWLALFGFLTSWTYLRFYKSVFPDLDSSQPASLRGDASETFAMAEFFPGPAKPVVATISDHVFDALVSARLCTPFSHADVSAARGDRFPHRGTPGSARAEAERRRAIALKALDQRLSAATAGPVSALPSNPVAPPVGSTVQAAMTSEPNTMLGETTFEPESGDEAGKS